MSNFGECHKTNAKLHGASTPSESTAADAVRNLIKKSTKRGGRGRAPPEVDFSDKEEDMYTIDDKSGEGVYVAVEESGGGLGMSTPAPRRGTDKAGKKRMENAGADGVTGMDGEEIEMRKKGDKHVWDEGYEQEKIINQIVECASGAEEEPQESVNITARNHNKAASLLKIFCSLAII
ncbi:hypothetical protein DFH11DRAFT_1818384 [Phellopilus nigrolimitatus]|nr:hypothetical protein DFH11DRAFT_1818384 [Phellopilus nigrolimitatus]